MPLQYRKPSPSPASTEEQPTWLTPKNSSAFPYSPRYTHRQSKLVRPQQNFNQDMCPEQPCDSPESLQFTWPDTEGSDTVELQDEDISPPPSEVVENLKGQINGLQFHIASLKEDMQVMELDFNDLMSESNVLGQHYTKLLRKTADLEAGFVEIRNRVRELRKEKVIRGDGEWTKVLNCINEALKKGNVLQKEASYPKYMGYNLLSRGVQQRIDNLCTQLDYLRYRLSEVSKH